jgi:hypothetical protein
VVMAAHWCMAFAALPYNCGLKPLLMFDGIANSAEPRALILRRAEQAGSLGYLSVARTLRSAWGLRAGHYVPLKALFISGRNFISVYF